MFLDPRIAALFKGTDGGLRLGVFFYLGLSPTPLRLWAGINNVPIGIPSIDPAGSVYVGAGKVVSIPDLELLINGIADRIDFFIDSTDPHFLEKLGDGAPQVLGVQTIVGLATLDERYQPQMNIIGIWSGSADLLKMSLRPGMQPTDPSVQRVAISCGTGDTSRARPRLTAFNEPQQMLISPTDRFYSQANRYNQQYVVQWPTY